MSRRKKRRKLQTQKTFPPCWYECRKCKFKWEDYRLVPEPQEENPFQFILDPDKPVTYIKLYGPGETLCPKCKHEYVHWVNYESFAEWYCKNVGDGGCGGEKKR